MRAALWESSLDYVPVALELACQQVMDEAGSEADSDDLDPRLSDGEAADLVTAFFARHGFEVVGVVSRIQAP